MSIISVPTTIAATSLKSSQNFFQPLNQAFETIKTEGQNKLGGFDTNLKEQYVNFGTNAISNTKDGWSQFETKLNEITQLGAPSADQVKTKAENINYYAFQLGDLVKAVVRSIPTIIRDTVLLMAKGDPTLHLLSAHKIYFIVKDDKFSEFIESLSNVVTQYAAIMSKMSGEDTSGIIQIFRELQITNINTFLGKVKDNSSKLDSNQSNYCNATKLMMHVLIGKETIEQLQEKVNTLTQQLESMKSDLQQILQSANINLDSLKTQLKSLSDSPKLKDPCQQKQN